MEQILANKDVALDGTQEGLLALYSFDEEPGSTNVTDLSGNGYTGTLTGLDADTSWVSEEVAPITRSAAAVGDPHITSIYGCKSEASLNQTSVVLMECEAAKLLAEYNEEWGYHIHTVEVWHNHNKDRRRYPWKRLKHPKELNVCGNTVEFHRYHLGINLRILHISNTNITGMFSDRSCH